MAGACAEFVWDHPNLGGYLKCLILGDNNIFNTIVIIFSVVVIIYTLILLNQTLRNLDNSKELAQVGQRWMYLAIAIVGMVGGLGIVFFGASLLGIEKSSVLQVLTDLFDALDTSNN